MKKLTKIKLINWHLYADSTIDVSNNVVICGGNGSGKSTLIDAIHFVISAGSCKFNTAANERNDRTLESYVRGKLGFENKNYLRNGDTISHVALEFFDDSSNKYLVIGAVIYSGVGTKIEKHFYHINNDFIKDEYYSKDAKGKKVPVTLKELNENYKKDSEATFREFSGTNNEIKNSLLGALGIEGENRMKYLELLPKALAFKPIGNINSFVFDYLLPERNLNLDNMKTSVRKYRDIKNLIDSEKRKLSFLEPIYDDGLKYEGLKKNLELFNTLYLERNYENTKKEKENLLNEINKINTQIHLYQTKRDELNNEKEELLKQINDLNNSEINKTLKDLLEKKRFYDLEIEKLNKTKNEISSLIEGICIKLDKLEVSNTLKSSFYKSNFIKFKDEIQQIKSKVDGVKESNDRDLAEYENDRKKAQAEYDSLYNNLQNLQRGLKNYGDNILNLKQILIRYFKEEYDLNIDVKVFSDLVEVNDENWRNALEGFLNNRKFNLFVDGKYYDEALRIYEKASQDESNNLYNVGLVNVNALNEVNKDEISENSLFNKLNFLTEDARKYAYYLLRDVNCVDNVDELKNYDISITKTCMLYQGKVARKIHPKWYRSPYLGRSSIEMQIDLLNKQIDEKVSLIEQLDESLSYCRDIKSTINYLNTDLSRIDIKDDIFAGILRNNESLKVCVEEIEKLKNSDLIKQQELIDNKTNRVTEIREELNEIENSSINFNAQRITKENEIDRINGLLSDSEKVLANSVLSGFYQEFKKKYEGSTIKEINDKINKFKTDVGVLEHEIVNQMRTFVNNKDNKCDCKPDIENVNTFISLYNEIKDRDLIKFEDDAKHAQETCDRAFKNDYILKIRDNIINEKDNIKELNNILKLDENKFGQDKETYEFVIEGTKDETLKQYYELFVSNEDYEGTGIFSSELSNKHRDLMDRLFERLTADNEADTEKELAKFIDYRNFMTYDIKITDRNNNVSYYSKGGKGKSGGETQTPFYVFIAASFNQLCAKNRFSMKNSPICLMFLDEAFNNMDESRIETMMKFYSKLKIQLIISVPTQRAATILSYSDTALGIVKQENNAFIIKLDNVNGN